MVYLDVLVIGSTFEEHNNNLVSPPQSFQQVSIEILIPQLKNLVLWHVDHRPILSLLCFLDNVSIMYPMLLKVPDPPSIA